jgi:hypothetical protein
VRQLENAARAPSSSRTGASTWPSPEEEETADIESDLAACHPRRSRRGRPRALATDARLTLLLAATATERRPFSKMSRPSSRASAGGGD